MVRYLDTRGSSLSSDMFLDGQRDWVACEEVQRAQQRLSSPVR